jgi:hypothetical protein
VACALERTGALEGTPLGSSPLIARLLRGGGPVGLLRRGRPFTRPDVDCLRAGVLRRVRRRRNAWRGRWLQRRGWWQGWQALRGR